MSSYGELSAPSPSSSSTSFASDLSPRMEWGHSRFGQQLDTIGFSIELNSDSGWGGSLGGGGDIPIDATESVLTLKEQIARYAVTSNDNLLPPPVPRLLGLNRSLSTLPEISDEREEDLSFETGSDA